MKVINQETGLEFELQPTREFVSDLEKHWQAVGCPHERTDIRCSTLKNGSKQMRYQCLGCGQLVRNSVPRSSVSSDVRDVDLDLLEENAAERKKALNKIYQKHIRIQIKQIQQGNREYDIYLKSPEWKKKRKKVLSRAGGVCEGCGENPATIVHHLTYEHAFNELLFELVALCESCHERCHPQAGNESSVEPHCHGCRWYLGDEQCSIFNVPIAAALAQEGPCGPSKNGFEQLK